MSILHMDCRLKKGVYVLYVRKCEEILGFFRIIDLKPNVSECTLLFEVLYSRFNLCDYPSINISIMFKDLLFCNIL